MIYKGFPPLFPCLIQRDNGLKLKVMRYTIRGTLKELDTDQKISEPAKATIGTPICCIYQLKIYIL